MRWASWQYRCAGPTRTTGQRKPKRRTRIWKGRRGVWVYRTKVNLLLDEYDDEYTLSEHDMAHPFRGPSLKIYAVKATRLYLSMWYRLAPGINCFLIWVFSMGKENMRKSQNNVNGEEKKRRSDGEWTWTRDGLKKKNAGCGGRDLITQPIIGMESESEIG